MSPVEKQQLQQKLDVTPTERLCESIKKLVGCQDTHDVWTTHIVQRAVENYETVLKQRITLADVHTTILDAIKENLPDNPRLSWDGLHPDAIVHFIFGAAFEEFFHERYEIVLGRKWMGDTALLTAKASGNLNPKLYKETSDLMIETFHLMPQSAISPTSEVPDATERH